MCDTNGAVIIRLPETKEQKVFLRPYSVFSGISSLWDKSRQYLSECRYFKLIAVELYAEDASFLLIAERL